MPHLSRRKRHWRTLDSRLDFTWSQRSRRLARYARWCEVALLSHDFEDVWETIAILLIELNDSWTVQLPFFRCVLVGSFLQPGGRLFGRACLVRTERAISIGSHGGQHKNKKGTNTQALEIWWRTRSIYTQAESNAHSVSIMESKRAIGKAGMLSKSQSYHVDGSQSLEKQTLDTTHTHVTQRYRENWVEATP